MKSYEIPEPCVAWFGKVLGGAALTIVAATVLFLAACSDGTLSGPPAKMASKPGFAVAGTVTTNDAVTSEFRVCKAGTGGAGTFTVTRTAEGSFGAGSSIVPSPIVIPSGQCVVVVEDDAAEPNGSQVTVTESPSTNLTSITGVFAGINGTSVISPDPTNGSTFFINSFHGVTLTYTNTAAPPPPPPPPPPGNQGCTPGYWKQSQHFDSWPVATSTTFAGAGFTFGFSGTLLSGLNTGGGGIEALARHAAAAYLNSLSSGVDFAYTTAEVIAIANGTGAYAGLSVEARKDLLAAANEGVGGCLLN